MTKDEKTTDATVTSATATGSVAQKQSVPQSLQDKMKEQLAQLAAMQDEIRAQAAEQGILLEEPPSEITAYKDTREVRPGEQIPGTLNSRPWTKRDLDESSEEKHSFVPLPVPSLVHPILDEKRRPKIFLDVNGLRCCLTVGVLNENISGMFYWAYKNAEDFWVEKEQFKVTGPIEGAPWINGGPNKENTWHYEPEAPSAWIDLDGRYYQPGAPMPGMSSDEE